MSIIDDFENSWKELLERARIDGSNLTYANGNPYYRDESEVSLYLPIVCFHAKKVLEDKQGVIKFKETIKSNPRLGKKLFKELAKAPNFHTTLDKLHEFSEKRMLREICSNALWLSPYMLRDVKGNVNTPSFYRHFVNVQSVKSIYDRAVGRDDVEAWKNVLETPGVVDIVNRIRVYNSCRLDENSKMQDFVMSLLPESYSPEESYHALIAAGKGEFNRKPPIPTTEDLLRKYNPAIAKNYGHFILSKIISAERGFTAAAYHDLAKVLIKDGADLFVAFKLSEMPWFPFEHYECRRKNAKEESNYMRNNVDKVMAKPNLSHYKRVGELVEIYERQSPAKERMRDREGPAP